MFDQNDEFNRLSAELHRLTTASLVALGSLYAASKTHSNEGFRVAALGIAKALKANRVECDYLDEIIDYCKRSEA